MKIKFVVILMALMANSIFAELVYVNPAYRNPMFVPCIDDPYFDVLYYKPECFDTCKVPEKATSEIHVNQAFKTVNDGCEGEIRYSLFRQKVWNPRKLDAELEFLCREVLGKIVWNGKFPELREADADKNYKDSVVYKVFNGNRAFCSFIEDADSDFAEGYKYVYVEFMYKMSQGVCVRTFLANDLKFFGMDRKHRISPDSDFSRRYGSFVFMNKNKSGKYVYPEGADGLK